MSYRDLAIAAMDNHRLFHILAADALARGHSFETIYYQNGSAQAQRELHVYLSWMIHHPASEDLRPAKGRN